MNVAIILAAGIGKRLSNKTPKQFLRVDGKPIIAYTLEIFQKNPNINAIEIVCQKKWEQKINSICKKYHISKKKWICEGGKTFQFSVYNALSNLKGKIKNNDIVVISFGSSPLTSQEDINDSIKICKKYGNGVSAKNYDLCTCVKDDSISSSRGILRESLKGFANPWSFKYGDVYGAYITAIDKNILEKIEPHTTSLYFALKKKIYFSSCVSPQAKITEKNDIDFFKAYLSLKKARRSK